MATVNSLFFDAVLTAASPDNVAMPNVGFDPGTLEKYYEIFIVPGRSAAVDMDSLNEQRGFCQVSCFVKEKVGEIKAVTMANKIIAAFPRNTRFKDTAFRIDIVQPAYYSQGLNTDNGWYMVPVTIPYVMHNI
jgi:hypothetical protein